MRLSILDHGHRRRARVFLMLTSGMSRVDSSDMVKMLLYRPGFLGRPLVELTADAMRGPSYWTAGEREYLAMCTAQLLQCPFCIDTHAELTRIAGHGDIDPDDPASGRPELRAARAFLATVTCTPDRADATGVADVAGLPEHAVLEALRVNLAFTIVNRLANAFGFTLREGQLHSGTRALHRFGYRFPRFLLADGETTRHGDAVENLRHAVLDAPATTDPALRMAAAGGGLLPEPWQSYAATVRDASYKITDTDIDRLTADGHTEEEIFEVTVAAAVGAAMHGFDAGRRALRHETTAESGSVVENGGGRSSSGASTDE
jgi:AhpD family alkylhydroperoxidase